MIRIVSESEEETLAIGKKMCRGVGPGFFIALSGDLGAGKSVIARGIARGLGIASAVQSPSFTVMYEYEEGRLPLYHFDAYRLESEDEMEALGYEEFFFSQGVTVLEWPERITSLLPPDRLDITISAGQAPEQRIITMTPRGENAMRVIKEAGL